MICAAPEHDGRCSKKTLLALESAAGCKREALVGTVNERLDYAVLSDKWR